MEPPTKAALPTGVKDAFFNATSPLAMSVVARYDRGELGLVRHKMQHVCYNPIRGLAYVAVDARGMLDVLPMADFEAGKIEELVSEKKDIRGLIDSYLEKAVEEGDELPFAFGRITDMEVYMGGVERLYILIAAEKDEDTGRLAVFSHNEEGDMVLMDFITIDPQPKALTLHTKDVALIAHEGKKVRIKGGEVMDPKAVVSIVNIPLKSVNRCTFERFDDPTLHEVEEEGSGYNPNQNTDAQLRDELVEKGLVLPKGGQISDVIEPEDIAMMDGEFAVVTLQEANALLFVKLCDPAERYIFPLGAREYSAYVSPSGDFNALDINTGDVKYLPDAFPSLAALHMPDGIKVYHSGGETYFVVVNEGAKPAPLRSYEAVALDPQSDESSPGGSIGPSGFSDVNAKPVLLANVERLDGLEEDKDYLLGSRSFSIFKLVHVDDKMSDDSVLQLVYNSGIELEAKMAEQFEGFYHLAEMEVGLDDRSNTHGLEPENVVLGQVGERVYAFISIKAAGGVMVYDVTCPTCSHFVNYINTRDFRQVSEDQDEMLNDTVITGGDIKPKGMVFVNKLQSKTGYPMLLVAHELSGTMIAIELKDQSNLPTATMQCKCEE